MQELTHGQKLVDLNFNAAKNANVQRLKELAAEQIDILESIHKETRGEHPDYDTNLLYGNALREVIGAQMATVKYATWDMPAGDANGPKPPETTGTDTSDPLNQRQPGAADSTPAADKPTDAMDSTDKPA
jgi:hypothetical protein